MFWEKLHQLDQQLTLTINCWYSSFSDPIWQFFSDKLVWIPMYVGIIALLFWKLGWKRALVVIAGVGLTFGFCDQFSNIIKDATCRLRPLNDEFMVANGLHILEGGGKYGFFSAHAANALGLAFCSYIGLRTDLTPGRKAPWWIKAYGGWIFFWATMVGISRIFVGKHYLGDVLVGFAVGAATGIVFGMLVRYVIRRFFSETYR
jgi:undecaprenyl-diphosphatase